MSLDVSWQGQAETNAEAWFNIALRPRKPEGWLGRKAQDGHLDFHTAPEVWQNGSAHFRLLTTFKPQSYHKPDEEI